MIEHEQRAGKFTVDLRRFLQCAPHFHTDLELAWIQQGTSVAHADSKSFPLKKGDVYLSFPNQVHSFSEDSDDLLCWLFIVPLSMCSDYKPLLRKQRPVCNHIPAQQLPAATLEILEQLSQQRGAYAEYVRKGYWLALLGQLLPLMQLEQHSGNENDVLRGLLDYCMTHLGDDLRLETVAEEACVGKYYISHLFKDRLGIGFHEYVNMMRVNEAAKLLTETTESVTDIAYQVGFSCPRSFNRAFLKQMLCTPRAYRQREGQNNGSV